MDAGIKTRQMNINRQTTRLLLRVGTHIGGWLPLFWLVWQYQQDLLGVDPDRKSVV